MTPQAGAGTQQDTKGRSEPAEHRVRIVLEDGKLKYFRDEDGRKNEDATRITVSPRDTVVWQCDHGNYSVLFKSKTPFENVAYHSHRGAPTREALVLGVNDEYHYAVTVVGDDGKPVVDDPVIIVDDGS